LAYETLGYTQWIRYWAPTKIQMISLRHFRQVIDKFVKSPAAGDARVQIVLPNGEFYDIKGVQLVQNKLVGVRESHRLLITIKPESWRMGKVLKKL